MTNSAERRESLANELKIISRDECVQEGTFVNFYKIADFILARERKQQTAGEDEVEELASFLFYQGRKITDPGRNEPWEKVKGSDIYNHFMAMAQDVLNQGYRKQSPEGRAVEQLKLSNEELKSVLKECGPCQHELNHCVCDLVGLIETNEAVIKERSGE